MITLYKLSKTENDVSEDLSKEECASKVGFIPIKPIRLLGSWKDANVETNCYGYFYNELVILTDKEYSKLAKRFKQWGTRDFKRLTKQQFFEECSMQKYC